MKNDWPTEQPTDRPTDRLVDQPRDFNSDKTHSKPYYKPRGRQKTLQNFNEIFNFLGNISSKVLVAYLSQLGYLLDFFTVCFGIFIVEVLDVLQQNAKNTNQGALRFEMKDTNEKLSSASL